MPRTMKADGTAAVIEAVSGIHLLTQMMLSAAVQGSHQCSKYDRSRLGMSDGEHGHKTTGRCTRWIEQC